MKKYIKTFLVALIIILLLMILTNNQMIGFVLRYFYQKNLVLEPSNEYSLKQDYNYVQITNQFISKSKQNTMNIIYTALDSGWEDFVFYCDYSYTTCLDDLNQITSDSYILSNINNFVHPYNAFDNFAVYGNSLGRIEIKVDYLYSNIQINEINNKVDQIYNEIITDNMTDRAKIKAVHDYIIDNTVYDNARILNNGTSDYESNLAYGPLIEGKAICGGYADAMALFLDKMGIPNYKIATDNHVWNLVKLNNTWYHLDLTWDDPVLNTGSNITLYSFFLITTKELTNINTSEHNYDQTIYSEAN